jgi:hypothetical protein
MKYTRIPENTFKELQMNAGILAKDFDPATGEVAEADLFGATTGGLSFSDSMSWVDLGEDIDNCPKDMMELKKLDKHEVKVSGTFVTMNPETAHILAAAADADENDPGHIIPRNDVLLSDFQDVWVIGDYSDVNEDSTEGNAGFIAIHLMNALNTGGFQIKTADKAKGQFAFEFTGHYSMNAQDTVPYELYVRVGGGEATPGVTLNKSTASIAVDGTETLTATTVPAGQTVTWTSSDDEVATVSGGVVTGVAAGTATITASITVDGQTYTATCAVTVTE